MAVSELLPLAEFGMQICRKCGKTLPFSEFYPLRSMRLGYRTDCRTCATAYARSWVEKNPEKAFDSHLRRRFGITLDEYNAMLAEQGGVCLICGELPTGPRNRRKGKQRTFIARLVRGLLCSTCNVGIGNLKDDAATVRAALNYLERK